MANKAHRVSDAKKDPRKISKSQTDAFLKGNVSSTKSTTTNKVVKRMTDSSTLVAKSSGKKSVAAPKKAVVAPKKAGTAKTTNGGMYSMTKQNPSKPKESINAKRMAEIKRKASKGIPLVKATTDAMAAYNKAKKGAVAAKMQVRKTNKLK